MTRDTWDVTVVTLTIHFTERMQSNFAQVQSCLDSVSRHSRSQSWSQVDFRVLVLRRLRLWRWRILSLWLRCTHLKVTTTASTFVVKFQETKLCSLTTWRRPKFFFYQSKNKKWTILQSWQNRWKFETLSQNTVSKLPTLLKFCPNKFETFKTCSVYSRGLGKCWKVFRTVCLLHSPAHWPAGC